MPKYVSVGGENGTEYRCLFRLLSKSSAGGAPPIMGNARHTDVLGVNGYETDNQMDYGLQQCISVYPVGIR
jgi:hypothetical protein